MDAVFDIITLIWNWLDANGIPISLGDFNAFISFKEIMIGLLICEVGIWFLYNLLGGD